MGDGRGAHEQNQPAGSREKIWLQEKTLSWLLRAVIAVITFLIVESFATAEALASTELMGRLIVDTPPTHTHTPD